MIFNLLPIQPQRREETGGDNNTTEERMDDNSVDTELRPVQLTTKETFRIGLPHLQAPDLRMRYATKGKDTAKYMINNI